jgi:hypothetical protein
MSKDVMPDLIRHPVYLWIPAFAGMTSIVAKGIKLQLPMSAYFLSTIHYCPVRSFKRFKIKLSKDGSDGFISISMRKMQRVFKNWG